MAWIILVFLRASSSYDHFPMVIRFIPRLLIVQDNYIDVLKKFWNFQVRVFLFIYFLM